MAKINAVGNGLSGATGSGSFTGNISPSLTTPSLGVATATSLAFSPTTNGIVGTTTNNNASAGYVGEFVDSIVLFSSAISLSNAVVANVTSINLTPGSWNVWGNITFNSSTGAGTTARGWSSKTSATLVDQALLNEITLNALLGSNFNIIGFSIPFQQYQSNINFTVFLSAFAQFNTGTMTACGGIYATRPR